MCPNSPRPASMASRNAGAMRSGRLCSSAGRQRSVTCDQLFRRLSSASSRPSAMQPMISTDEFIVAHPRLQELRARRAPFLDETLGDFHGGGCVPAIGVGPARLAELLVERRAAHQPDEVLAPALRLQ